MEFRLRQEPVPPNGPSSTTLPSSGRRHEGAIARFPSRLLPVTDQHIAAGGTKLCAIFLEASQDSEIALIHQLTAETLHVARASFLLLIGAAVSEGAHWSRDVQQEKRHQEFVHHVPPSDFRKLQRSWGRAAVHSITIAWSLPSADGALRSKRNSLMNRRPSILSERLRCSRPPTRLSASPVRGTGRAVLDQLAPGQLAQPDIEHRRQEQAEQSNPDHAGEHGDAGRRAHLGAGAM